MKTNANCAWMRADALARGVRTRIVNVHMDRDALFVTVLDYGDCRPFRYREHANVTYASLARLVGLVNATVSEMAMFALCFGWGATFAGPVEVYHVEEG